MMSSRIRPKSSRGSRQNPSIHDVRLPPPLMERSGNSFAFRDRATAASRVRLRPVGLRRDSLRAREGLPSRSALQGREGWWSQTGSNRRPHACKARALPTELWPLISRGGRSWEPSSISSPRPQGALEWSVVGPGRLELPTSRLSGVCSNQLSYRPLKRSAQEPGAGPALECAIAPSA